MNSPSKTNILLPARLKSGPPLTSRKASILSGMNPFMFYKFALAGSRPTMTLLENHDLKKDCWTVYRKGCVLKLAAVSYGFTTTRCQFRISGTSTIG